jgi:hypothetical protein
MINLFWSGLITMLLLSGCGWNGTPTRSPEGIIPLTSIEIIPVYSKIAAGTSIKLTAKGFYSGVPSDITDQVVWSSSNESVAKFNFAATPNKNRISGVAAGNVVVTATVGNVSATYALQVTNATVASANMVISPINPSVHKGLTTQLTVVGTFSDNTTQDLTFDANWSPTAGTNAKVSNDPASKGLATALVEGPETITASFGTANASTSLVVTAPLLLSITVTPANSSIAGSSKTVNFTAKGTYSDGTSDTTGITATWKSSAIGVATIDTNNGVATTVAVGKTTISATLSNADGVSISGNTDLTVTALSLNTNGLQISPVNPILSLSSATTLQLTLTATFADNSTQIVTSSASWSIPAGSSIATVGTTTGLVTATNTGTVTIQALYLGQSATATVTIQ